MKDYHSKLQILIVEDEATIAESLEFVLQNEGFSTHWVNLAEAALKYLLQHPVALVILDIGLPDISGLEALKQLRKTSDVPVMFLTARSDEIDRIVGLEVGADDYVVKPFSPREVAARVKTILKRVTIAPPTLADDTGAIAKFEINDANKSISFCQQAVPLTRSEYEILYTLLSHPGRVYSRQQLLDTLNIPCDVNYERSIDTHIKEIRSKLRTINSELSPIKTQRGFGYMYQESER